MLIQYNTYYVNKYNNVYNTMNTTNYYDNYQIIMINGESKIAFVDML